MRNVDNIGKVYIKWLPKEIDGYIYRIDLSSKEQIGVRLSEWYSPYTGNIIKSEYYE